MARTVPGRLGDFALTLLVDLVGRRLAGLATRLAFADLAATLEALRLDPNPSDIPINTPLASVAKFWVSKCAALKLVSR